MHKSAKMEKLHTVSAFGVLFKHLRYLKSICIVNLACSFLLLMCVRVCVCVCVCVWCVLLLILETYVRQKFSFFCFDSTFGFCPDDFAVVDVCSSWVGFSVLNAFRRLPFISLHSSLSQIALCITSLHLLFGIVHCAMEDRMSVKLPIGSPALTIQSTFKSEAAFSEKASQSALCSFQVLLAGLEPQSVCIITG